MSYENSLQLEGFLSDGLFRDVKKIFKELTKNSIRSYDYLGKLSNSIGYLIPILQRGNLVKVESGFVSITENGRVYGDGIVQEKEKEVIIPVNVVKSSGKIEKPKEKPKLLTLDEIFEREKELTAVT